MISPHLRARFVEEICQCLDCCEIYCRCVGLWDVVVSWSRKGGKSILGVDSLFCNLVCVDGDQRILLKTSHSRAFIWMICSIVVQWIQHLRSCIKVVSGCPIVSGFVRTFHGNDNIYKLSQL